MVKKQIITVSDKDEVVMIPDKDKNDIIDKVYYDPAGHSSIRKTYEDAKKLDKDIKYVDVKAWFEKNIERTTQLKGYNSYVAPEPKFGYQIDFFFMNYLKDPEYSIGLLMVDIFTKFIVIIPIKNKEAPTLLEAMKEAITKMGGPPKMLFSDNEPALNTKLITDYLEEHDIKLVMTRSHAAVAERAIRTIKAMIEKRIETAKKKDDEIKRWVDVLFPVLLTYNNKDKHSTINMTPNEARKPENELKVETNLQLKAKHTRIYPEIEIGDKVRLYQKKTKMDKERIPNWQDEKKRIQKLVGEIYSD
jgi:hypothetical protein